jgi:EAL and modified HD-GYP domain-containing signal transduction protein
LFARQPVFTADLRVFGHELLYRHAMASTTADMQDIDAATLTVVAGAFQWQPEDLAEWQKILVNFGRRAIVNRVPYALPARRTVVQVREDEVLDDAFLAALADLKKDGYTLAVDGYEARMGAGPLIELADLAVIDTLGRGPEELLRLLDPVAKRGVNALAARVEDAESFARAKKLGFGLFQGYFFKRPEIVAGRRLASGEVARLKLLRLTQKNDPDEAALEDTIRADVTLTYRLLAYLNSPLHGERMPRLSVKRAMAVLGWTQLRHWLKVIALTDFAPTPRNSELSFLALTRGRFFELVAQGLDLDATETDKRFTLGLFSLLDTMLRAPMAEITLALPLDKDVKAALNQEPGVLTPWLVMVRALEQGEWETLEGVLRVLGIPADLAAASYAKAMEFASKLKSAPS